MTLSERMREIARPGQAPAPGQPSDTPADRPAGLREGTRPAARDLLARRARARRRRAAALGLVLLAAAATAAGYYAFAPRPGPLDGVVTVPVRMGDVEDTITALGRLQPRAYVDVGAQVSGQLRRIAVREGQEVREGELLAEIEATIQAARVEAGRAELRALRAQLGEQETRRALAVRQYERQAQLMKGNATSRDAYEIAEAEVRAAEARLTALKAQIEQRESALKADEATLGYTRIYAPMPGTVVSITARQGQTLNANQQAPVLMRVADLSAMTVRTQVSEADVSRLAPGMEVYFTTLGAPERRWSGTLAQILPMPEVVNNVVLYTALFDVDNAGGALMADMSAQVFFVRQAARGVLTVPAAALRPVRPADGLYEVGVATPEGTVERREVTIGVRDRIRAEVLAGLARGERVVAGRERQAGAQPRGAGQSQGQQRRAPAIRL